MAKLVEQSAAIALRDDGTARIVVVSDTHSRPHPLMAERLAEQKPDAILHGGDIGELAVLDELAQAAPVFAVRGNIDLRAPGVPDVLLIDLVAGDTPRFKILLTHIAVYGPKIRAEVAKRARAANASLIVCGHSHVPFIGQDRGLTVFNPGSIGPRRFSLPIVFGTIDVTPAGVALAHVSCESGQRWRPP